MKIFWVIYYTNTDETSHCIKNIKFDSGDYSAFEIKDLIYKSFNLEPNLFNLRLRNRQGNLMPINKNIEANTKKDPFYLEVYRYRINSIRKQNEPFRPVTRQTRVFVNYVFVRFSSCFLKIQFFFSLNFRAGL